MEKKIIYIFPIFLLLISLISAASYDGTLSVNTGSGSVVINSGGCQEDWSNSAWSSCINGVQTFICFDKNQCGTTNLIPAQCGNTESCTTQPLSSSGGGGSSGGGSSGGGSSGSGGSNNIATTNSNNCVENWQCGEWSNANEQCGKRICVDENNCSTSLLKPATSKECPSVSSLSFTGAVTGIANFAQTGQGVATIGGLITIIVFAIAFTSVRRKKTTQQLEKSASETK